MPVRNEKAMPFCACYQIKTNLGLVERYAGNDTFSYVPGLPGWSFLRLICEGNLPPPLFSRSFGSGARASPTDKSGKDGALTSVTREKAPLPFQDASIDVTEAVFEAPFRGLPHTTSSTGGR